MQINIINKVNMHIRAPLNNKTNSLVQLTTLYSVNPTHPLKTASLSNFNYFSFLRPTAIFITFDDVWRIVPEYTYGKGDWGILIKIDFPPPGK